MRDTSAAGRAARCALALVAALVLVTLAPTAPAGAKLVHVGSRTLSYLPAPDAGSSRTAAVRRAATPAGGKGKGEGGGAKPSSSSPLVYHSPGPVMPANTNYTIFWAPGGSGSYPAGYQSGIDRFFEDLAHDSGGVLNSDSVLAQYGDSGGHFAAYSSHFGGTILDTDPYPANGCSQAPVCLTDAQFKTEIRAVVEAHNWPMDLEHEYFVLTPEGVESCMEAEGKVCSDGTPASVRAYCAYHRFVEVGASTIVYANDPFVAGLSCDTAEHPNGNASDATIAGGLAHEHSESVTDPLLNAWYDSKGNEVADKCRSNNAKVEFGEPLGLTPEGVSYNQLIDGDYYLYQQMWSNQAGACLQRVGEYPAVTKMKPKNGPPSGGTTVTITGHGFTSPATVRFGEALATGVKVESSSTIVAVSPAAAANQKVAVTVTTAAGTSAATKKSQFKYKSH